MFNLLRAAAAAAIVGLATPVAAQAPGYSATTPAFDASQARSVAESLVLCDLAAYLGSAPDRNATRVYVRRDDFRFEPLIPPFVSMGGNWYDEDLERAYRRYRAAGVVTSEQLYRAQDTYSRSMTRAFERPSLEEQKFLQSQAPFCRTLARDAPR